MKPSERREFNRRTLIASGDRRAALIAATPVSDRSETAARYDHSIEAARLRASPISADEMDAARARIVISRQTTALIEGGYEKNAFRLASGHIMSAGMLRIIATVETSVDDAEAIMEAERGRAQRLTQLTARYGV